MKPGAVVHEPGCPRTRIETVEARTDGTGGHASVHRCLDCAAAYVHWHTRPTLPVYDPHADTRVFHDDAWRRAGRDEHDWAQRRHLLALNRYGA